MKISPCCISFQAIFLLITSLLITACSSNDSDEDTLSIPSDVIWVWSEYTPPNSGELLAIDVEPGTTNTDYFVQFASDSYYRGGDGCNTFAGHWATWENVVYLIDKTSTGAACPVVPNELNSIFNLPVGSEIEYEITNDKLILALADGATFTFTLGE